MTGVVDDRAIPVGDIHRAIGTDLAIHRAKIRVLRADQRLQHFGAETRAVIEKFIADNSPTLEAARQQLALYLVRHVRAGNQIPAALLFGRQQQQRLDFLRTVSGRWGQVTDTQMKPFLYNKKENILNPHVLMFGDISIDWSQYL